MHIRKKYDQITQILDLHTALYFYVDPP